MVRLRLIWLNLILLHVTSWAANGAAQPSSLSDLQFYLTAQGCFENYVYCSNNVKPKAPKTDCLKYSNCQHLNTLQAIINLPYVQSQILTLANNDSLNKLLISYGRNNLEQLIEEYAAISKNLISDLITALTGADQKILHDNNIYITPPADFNG